MTKAIIFDLDGTLADTIQDITDGINSMLTEYGFPTLTVEDSLKNINNGAFELVRRSLPSNKRTDDKFIKEAKLVYEKYYAQCYNRKTSEYQGWTETLKKLSAFGISLNVLSNKQDAFVKEIIKKLFPDIKFDFVIGQSEQFKTKPDPSAVNHILSSLGVQPEEALFIGDSNVDMITAKNSNITPIGVSWGYRSREILIENGASFIIDTPDMLCNVPNILI